ncbi:MAG TPA: DinB family protein [Candidatus Dormibacteraeota bacterium]
MAPIFEGWHRTQAHLIHRVPKLEPQELQLRASPEGWPIWAIVSHLAGARVYWLCGVLKERGAETTPFRDPLGEGWEDRLDVPRQSGELMFAVESSWQIIESCLARWTPKMLGEAFIRVRDGDVQKHTRQSVLTRIVMHDAFHCGEVSILLGTHGFASMDPWEPIS